MLKMQLCITGINNNLEYIQIKTYFQIVVIFHSITVLTVFLIKSVQSW